MKALLKAGANVLSVDTTSDVVKSTTDSELASAIESKALQLFSLDNLYDESSIESYSKEVVRVFGSLDIVIFYNSSPVTAKHFTEISGEEYEAQHAVVRASAS